MLEMKFEPKGAFMKVAVALDSYPHVGGGHQYALSMVNALQNIPEIEILYLCNTGFWRKWCHENEVNYKLVNWPTSFGKISTEYGFVSKLYNHYFTHLGIVLNEEKVDVLITTMQNTYMIPLKTRVIMPIHDLMHRYESDFPEVSLEYELREKTTILQARFADAILTDSQIGATQYEESYSRYIGKKQNTYVLPFVVNDYINNIKEEYIQTPSKYIFYPAQFWKHKNHINLIKAIEMVREEIPDICLVLSGSKKNYYHEVLNYIKEHELEKNIVIMGYVTNEQMTYLYKHAVALFMVSIFGPTNIPPLEAMALGCPVAVSNNYGMPEQVGEAGMLFDPCKPEEIAECICKIWNDKELQNNMRKKGIAQANGWTEKDFAERIKNIIFNI